MAFYFIFLIHRTAEGIPSAALREISLLKELNHENVVKLYDTMMSGNNLFLIFEFMDYNLKQVLELRQEEFGSGLPEPEMKVKILFYFMSYFYSIIH